jgi:hypothetical protein
MPRPPVQQAAAIGVPATDRSQALEEAVLGWLTALRLRAQSPAARDQSYDHHPDPHMTFHKILSLPADGLLGLRKGRRR